MLFKLGVQIVPLVLSVLMMWSQDDHILKECHLVKKVWDLVEEHYWIIPDVSLNKDQDKHS